MKQIVDKLNKIAKAIDENVELPTTDLIIDSLDAIITAYGGTPNESNLIVDKLEDIAEVAHGGVTPTGNIEITENTPEGEPLDISQYATATVNVSGGGANFIDLSVTVTPAPEMPNGYSIVYNQLRTSPYVSNVNEYSEDNLTTEKVFSDICINYFEGTETYYTTVAAFDSDETYTPYVIDCVNCTATINDGLTDIEITDPSLPATVHIGFQLNV